MRFNDGFGDTINWDLIPQFAISAVDIIPAPTRSSAEHPRGALAVRTKRGFRQPGLELGVSGGSWGAGPSRVNTEDRGARSTGSSASTSSTRNGWRDESSSELRQAFAKVGYRTAQTDVELSYTFANNSLVGNGLAPESTLAKDRSAVYTFPDETRNLMNLVNLREVSGSRTRCCCRATCSTATTGAIRHTATPR